MKIGSNMKTVWALTKGCWRILKKNKKFIVFPLLTLLFPAVFSLFPRQGGELRTSLTMSFFENLFPETNILARFTFYLSLVMDAFVIYIVLFLTAAFVRCILISLEGNKPTFRQVLTTTRKFDNSIGIYALFSVGIWVGEKNMPLFSITISFIWCLILYFITYFVIPVLVYEEINFITAIKRSIHLLKRVWKLAIIFHVGFILAMFLADMGSMMIVSRFSMSVDVIFFAISVAIYAIFSITYNTILYIYAITGMLPSEFPKELIPEPRKEE